MEIKKVGSIMEAQRESFIFHMEYIEGVPEELEAEYAMHAINYALKGIEPKLEDWRDQKMWNAIKTRIDTEAEQYEATVKARAAAGRNHRGNQYTRAKQIQSEPQEPNNSELEQNGTKWNKMEQDGTNGTVYEFDYESEFESENETESDAPKVPVKEPPPLQAYAQKVFEIFKSAGLPCARSNFISFLQRDFKNGMAYIHTNHPGLHSDDVIGAAENYAKTVNDPRSFITGKYSFERFVTFKNFIDFLPANYDPENFIDRKATGGAPPTQAKKWQEECPDCHAKALEYSNKLEKYICTKCGRQYTYEQITGD